MDYSEYYGADPDTYVAYLFSSSDVCDVGSYSGNSANLFNYLPFRPRWIMIKNEDAGYGWFIFDADRNTVNPLHDYLFANSSAAETSNSGYNIDALSNGFRVIGESSGLNNSSFDYIYLAFAESPLKYANAR